MKTNNIQERCKYGSYDNSGRKVPISKAKEFETAYESLKQDALTQGLIRSSLLRKSDDREIYRIETVWESREALEKMRSVTQTPKAIELFQKVKASPRLEIYDIVYNIP